MKYTTQPGSWKRTLLSTTTAAAIASAGMMGISATVQAEETFKVGLVTFLSGGASGPFGVPAAQAAETVIKAINSPDIKAGHTVAVVGSVASGSIQ
ncbi:hypothetical protein [Halomonas sp. BM-2019]|uniref:hypothetical protein n=1 Tax=Halomonas sp. BM-2019 TaxID=2811227 RepID=UPI001B3C3DFE|nr:MAG: hypothetical protein J5F18_02005 [Halomonas sp. BM-2019]